MCAGWLNPALNPVRLRIVARTIADQIMCDLANGVSIHGLAVRGLSGVTIGAVVSAYTGVPLVIVRKPGEHTHSHESVELAHVPACYAFLDDFIDEGDTLAAVVNALPVSKLTRIYLYMSEDDNMTEYEEVYHVKIWQAKL